LASRLSVSTALNMHFVLKWNSVIRQIIVRKRGQTSTILCSRLLYHTIVFSKIILPNIFFFLIFLWFSHIKSYEFFFVPTNWIFNKYLHNRVVLNKKKLGFSYNINNNNHYNIHLYRCTKTVKCAIFDYFYLIFNSYYFIYKLSIWH